MDPIVWGKNSSIQLRGKKHQATTQRLNGHHLVPERSTLKGLFQLNDSKSFIKWVDITISTAIKTGWLSGARCMIKTQFLGSFYVTYLSFLEPKIRGHRYYLLRSVILLVILPVWKKPPQIWNSSTRWAEKPVISTVKTPRLIGVKYPQWNPNDASQHPQLSVVIF